MVLVAWVTLPHPPLPQQQGAAGRLGVVLRGSCRSRGLVIPRMGCPPRPQPAALAAAMVRRWQMNTWSCGSGLRL